jgi:uroporphyrinogen decarboxylase
MNPASEESKMPLSERENYLRAVEFRSPQWIPVTVGFAPATWKRYREHLEEMLLRHPAIFPGYVPGSTDFDHVGEQFSRLEPDGPSFRTEGALYQDSWGCLWRCAHDDLGGQVVEHPLADWKALDGFRPPDILRQTRWGEDREDWNHVKNMLEDRKKRGILATVRIPCFFDRLHYLRGFENLLCDLASDPPELSKLIELVLETNLKLISKLLELGADLVDHHGDLGTQRALMMSTKTFRRYLKPGYARMFLPFRQAGIPIRYSSDGNLLEIVEDLRQCGVSAHDPQLSVNTLEGIVEAYKGRLCAIVDFGQEIILFNPRELRECVRETVEKLGAPEGGLVLRIWAIPDVPLENLEAFCSAAERFCFGR